MMGYRTIKEWEYKGYVVRFREKTGFDYNGVQKYDVSCDYVGDILDRLLGYSRIIFRNDYPDFDYANKKYQTLQLKVFEETGDQDRAEASYIEWSFSKPKCKLCGLPVEETAKKYFKEFCTGSCKSIYNSAKKEDMEELSQRWRAKDAMWLNEYFKKNKRKVNKEVILR